MTCYFGTRDGGEECADSSSIPSMISSGSPTDDDLQGYKDILGELMTD